MPRSLCKCNCFPVETSGPGGNTLWEAQGSNFTLRNTLGETQDQGSFLFHECNSYFSLGEVKGSSTLGEDQGSTLGEAQGNTVGEAQGPREYPWGSPRDYIFTEKPKESKWKTFVFYDYPESSKWSAAVQATSPTPLWSCGWSWFCGPWPWPWFLELASPPPWSCSLVVWALGLGHGPSPLLRVL